MVGSKGEIYTNDRLRREVGIKKGGRVRARVSGDKLVIEPLPSLKEQISSPVIRITPEEAEKLSEEAQKEAGAYG